MNQYDRRREPYPWTWEPTVAVATVLVTATQVGRAAANLGAGRPLCFPTFGGWLTSTPGVLTGDAAAGLPSSHAPTASTALLIGCVTVTAALLLGLTLALALTLRRRWGPERLQGMARPEEVRDTLGLRRLRRARSILRPDLYPHRSQRMGRR